jgi:hypothetical protein
MRFFLSKRDKSLLLIVSSASGSAHMFKVMAEETWKLVWSGIATEEFLEAPAWGWEPVKKDPADFPGGWPKQKELP